MAKRPSVQEILAAARKGGAAQPQAEEAPAAGAPEVAEAAAAIEEAAAEAMASVPAAARRPRRGRTSRRRPAWAGR